jgi:undecaprenyl-diphosphatase
MPLYQAIVLAVIQGLTEFLPVSSTAHLWIVPWICKWQDPGLTFDVALHAGTLAAVLLFFWRYWLEMIKLILGLGGKPLQAAAENGVPSANGGPSTNLTTARRQHAAGSIALLGENRQLFWFLVLATIPGGVAGFLFERAADERLRSPFVIGTALIVVGLIMWAGEHVATHEHHLNQVSLLDALIVGTAQAFAVIPGVSRSGSTMAAGLFRRMTRETAARFSFLLATPLIAGACLKKGLEIHHAGVPADMRLPFILGILVSAVVGYAVIGVLIRYLERRTFKVFVVYRLVLGVVLLAVGWGLRH